ncbi:hypothetical protein C0J52_01119 [Blattella germanica]|nr:hypothetical protein C0J52_01119 [Blattella germanica]
MVYVFGSLQMARAEMSSYKVFNDCVHSHIKLHPLCIAIIDTPEFQRLRNLKQLGLLYYVYPGGSHNRFEHSLGVSYLAGQMVEALRRANEDPNIVSDDEKLCVEVAGLCHDLGHGPFSHSWEQFVNRGKNVADHWKHEKSSIQLFDYLMKNEKNDIKKKIEEAHYLKAMTMIDAFYHAEREGFKISKGVKSKTLSTAHEDIELLNKMTDHVFYDILYNEEYEEASALLERIQRRDLYPILGRKIFSADLAQELRTDENALRSAKSMKDFVKKKINYYKETLNENIDEVLGKMSGSMLEPAKFQSKIISINLGTEITGEARNEDGKINPFMNIYFYEKNKTEPMEVDWKDIPTMPIPQECTYRIEGLIFYKTENKPEEVTELEEFKVKLRELWESKKN